MNELVKYCDVIMGNIWAANYMLDLQLNLASYQVTQKNDLVEAAYAVSTKIQSRFPRCNSIANTFRVDDNGKTIYFGTLFSNSILYQSKTYCSQANIEKVGSGDCFMSGLIFGICNSIESQNTLEFATAAAFSKLSIPGDCTNLSVAQIQKFIYE